MGCARLCVFSVSLSIAPLEFDTRALAADVGWHIENVDERGEVGAHAQIALDAAGHPHIAYYDQTRDRLRFAVWDGVSWQFETVEAQIGLRGDVYYSPHQQHIGIAWDPLESTCRHASLSIL